MSPGNLGHAFVNLIRAVGKVLSPSQGHETIDLIKDQIDASLKWVSEETYSRALYTKVLSVVEDELEVFWRMGKLKGVTQAQAFFARCDDTTMTEADIAAHRIVCLIGVAPVSPGEFILFDIVQIAA